MFRALKISWWTWRRDIYRAADALLGPIHSINERVRYCEWKIKTFR